MYVGDTTYIIETTDYELKIGFEQLIMKLKLFFLNQIISPKIHTTYELNLMKFVKLGII